MEDCAAADVLPPLLPELITSVFLHVPVDTRLRCREVARRWRAFLNDTRLWVELNMGKGFSSTVPRSPGLLITAASERAGGTLVRLDVSGLELISERDETAEGCRAKLRLPARASRLGLHLEHKRDPRPPWTPDI